MKSIHRIIITIFARIITNLLALFLISDVHAKEVTPFEPGQVIKHEIIMVQPQTYLVSLIAEKSMPVEVEHLVACTYRATASEEQDSLSQRQREKQAEE